MNHPWNAFELQDDNDLVAERPLLTPQANDTTTQSI